MSDHVRCGHCGTGNASDQRFCGNCGSSLIVACASCGTENPPGFRFCGSCGASLEAGTAVVGAATEERRWATVLFGDLSGFTKMSERMDPEDVRSLIDRCMTKLGEIVIAYEGRTERVSGDGIMCVFGAPIAHEDDPERAVRAALEMQQAASEHAAEFGGLPMRIGVNTGEMMFAPVGPEGARHHTMMGDAVNTASRLETAAPLNGVLVGGATYDATKHSIRYERLEPIVAKGKEQPVAAWLAIEATADPASRTISEAPIVGRAGELELLRNVWDRVHHEEHAHLVTVIGPPGIGKSKLAREFVSAIEGAQVLWGRSLPYGERAGGAFGQVLRQVADAYVTDEATAIKAKLQSAVSNVTGESDEELADHLASIIGIGSDEVDRIVLFSSARRFVECLAARVPTILVFEDVQWADNSLLDLLQWLIVHLLHAPVLLLTLARPELLDSKPGWGGGMTAYTAMPLGPLPDSEARDLAHQIRGGLSEDDLDRIQRVAGGNPLFVEELAAWFEEERDTTAGELPNSVTSIVAARLDGLPATTRRVLLDASVVGLTFWRGSLEALGGGELLDATLDELAARDLIRRQPTSRVPGDEQFVFRHQLIRDVAYDILPKATRKQRHADVARFIEGRIANPAPLASMLARHWQDAGDDDRAFDYFVVAAEVAGRGWDQQEAIALLRQAHSLVRDDDVARKRKITMKLAVARQIFAHSVLDADTIKKEERRADGPHHH